MRTLVVLLPVAALLTLSCSTELPNPGDGRPRAPTIGVRIVGGDVDRTDGTADVASDGDAQVDGDADTSGDTGAGDADDVRETSDTGDTQPADGDVPDANDAADSPDAITSLPETPIGFGADTVGGSGGTTYTVTSTADSGSDTLREALEAQGNRIVEFAVDAPIVLSSPILIDDPNITVDGASSATFPVTITGAQIRIQTQDVILRHLRFRPVTCGQRAIEVLPGTTRLLIDHISATWAGDEPVEIGSNDSAQPILDVTVQWSIIADSLDCDGGTQGGFELYGYTQRASVHHSVFGIGETLVPNLGPVGPFEFVNNIVYDPKIPTWVRIIPTIGAPVTADIVANLWLHGPDSPMGPLVDLTDEGDPSILDVYMRGNRIDDSDRLSDLIATSDDMYLVADPTVASSAVPEIRRRHAAVSRPHRSGARRLDHESNGSDRDESHDGGRHDGCGVSVTIGGGPATASGAGGSSRGRAAPPACHAAQRLDLAGGDFDSLPATSRRGALDAAQNHHETRRGDVAPRRRTASSASATRLDRPGRIQTDPGRPRQTTPNCMSTLWSNLAASSQASLGFFWKAGWAFILGYGISAMIQAFVPKKRLTDHMGDGGPKGIALATIFGAISSSCSFAALATARALVLKGAHFREAVAFMFASTNLVIELGILILIFLGPPFLVAEVIGGVVLIAISAMLLKWFAPEGWFDAARERVEEAAGDLDEDFDWRTRITSWGGWKLVGERFVAEWQMVWKEIFIGFSIAGLIAVWIPDSAWSAVFLTDVDIPDWLRMLENALVGPLVAMTTFIGSMGNIPLATVLASSGVLFAGIMAFIYSDLVVPPLVMVNKTYYGWRVALLIAVVMYISMVVTALLLALGFGALGLTPESRRVVEEVTRFAIDYTFFMNIAFVVVAGGLIWLSRRDAVLEGGAEGRADGDEGSAAGEGGRHDEEGGRGHAEGHEHGDDHDHGGGHDHDHGDEGSSWLTPKNVAVGVLGLVDLVGVVAWIAGA